MRTTEERLDFLEREYERLYHQNELLSIYIPQMCDKYEDFVRRFWAIVNTNEDLKHLFKCLYEQQEREQQEHFKTHSKEKKPRSYKY